MKAGGTMLLAASLWLLIGCQGFSSTPSNPNQGTGGNLSFGTLSLNFGSVAAGTSKTLNISVTNTATTSLTISSASVSTQYFALTSPSLPASIAAGQSVSLAVTFDPNAAGNFAATVAISSDASNAVTNISLAGTGISDGQLALNPASEAFGTVTVGARQSQTVTLTNTGGTSVTISGAAVTGTGFQLSGITTPLTLNASQSTTFTVGFAPQAAGSASGNVTITSDATNPTLSLSLTGTGTTAIGQLTVSPATLNLGSVVVGASGTASGTLTASVANVTVTGATTNNSVFSIGGLSLPVTIPAEQSASYSITFSPLTSGTANATLTVVSNAQPASSTQALTGTGTPAPTHSVNLSWNASTSPGISGYNVYRALYTNASCGSFSKINSVLETATLYTDSAVVNGKAYCYAATAVNTSNQESGYSNIAANVQIPIT
ncbi:MAG TPA: choice-of-anchor D domain-containing protein [Candidatus Sulfotelmatobacter sp.]|nr:choice-of-anchor D domain-containing protein [Candidatus Sulfotelmatobacter sp.]